MSWQICYHQGKRVDTFQAVMKTTKTIIAIIGLTLMIAGAPVASAQSAPLTDPALIEALYNQVTGSLQCLCGGCQTTIKNCPHGNCGFSIPERKRIRQDIIAGLPPDQIMAAYVARYGQVILSKPEEKGFNLVGYYLPYFILAAVAGVLYWLASLWARRGEKRASQGATTSPTDPEQYDDRLERELAEFEK